MNHRIFKKLCREMGAQHEVLYHTEVSRLSKGQVLKRLIERERKFHSFSRENKILSQRNLAVKSFRVV